MSDATTVAVSELVQEAIIAYADDPVGRRMLETYSRRLEEPLRVAIAGMVKAGKSTLLNAIIGEEIAPTDTAECTRIVTWYRYADTPRVTLYPVEGEPQNLPVRRIDGRLLLDVGAAHAEDVDRLVVDWPSKSLRDITLIDTPGIASVSEEVSARSIRFLTPEDAPSEADAIVYLLRHMHASDLNFLESFRDTTAGHSGTVNALAVLSRADEIGAGRIDSLLSARGIAERYRRDDRLRALTLGIVPVAGLLAQSARSLRETEYTALVALARLDRAERERLLVSVDRFARGADLAGVSSEVRIALLDRFGLFGIRLATALLRGGIADSTVLAHELARRSGLDELLRLIDAQFHARASLLKARAALVAVETLLRERPRTGTEELSASLERIQAGAHEFREMRLLATARTTRLTLAPTLTAEAERIIGGSGVELSHRLGLPDSATADELRYAALEILRRWRALAENPLTDRAATEVCRVVVRSCEAALAHLSGNSGREIGARIGLGLEPGAGSGENTYDERDDAEHELHNQ
ncbi:dynamin family protein [Mycetocola sp.]|uniref:dynamin family protein n=1 Tax=Mycetocola sp. TaxID=1871042 RepID=UPI003989A340